MHSISDELFGAIGELTKMASRVKDMMDALDTGSNPDTGDKPKVSNRAAAEAQVLADFDNFDDLVMENGLDHVKLTEYSTKIPFIEIGPAGKVTGYLYKYPKFLERLGVKDLVAVSYLDILKHFAPDLAKKLQDEDELNGKVAESLGYFLTNDPDITRTLTDADREYAKKTYGVDLDRFETLADMAASVSFEMPTLDEIAEYTYDDDPVQLDDLMAQVPESLRKMINV